jgi:hypothetical protein
LPIVDVFLVGPIEVVEFSLDGKVEFSACGFPLWVALLPFVFLAQPVEFGNGRVLRLGLELGILREKPLQRRLNA